MELRDKISGLDTSYKIGIILIGALAIGFVANSLTSSPIGLSGGQSHEVYQPTANNLAASGGLDDVSRDQAERGQGSSGSDRKVVTTVRTKLKVGDVSKAQDYTREQVEKYSGFIESSSIDRENEVSGRMTVAIPDKNLSSFTGGLESNYRVESQNTDRRDVTDRYNELESELETKKQEMEQLKELMNRTDNVSELVKIQERMSELRSRIDYLQKRLDNLDERVSYSRVHITYEGPELLKVSFNLKETFFQAYRAVFDSVRLIIIGTAYLLPLLVLAGLYKLLRGRVSL